MPRSRYHYDDEFDLGNRTYVFCSFLFNSVNSWIILRSSGATQETNQQHVRPTFGNILPATISRCDPQMRVWTFFPAKLLQSPAMCCGARFGGFAAFGLNLRPDGTIRTMPQSVVGSVDVGRRGNFKFKLTPWLLACRFAGFWSPIWLN